MTYNNARYDPNTLKKTLAVAVAMSMLIVCVPVGAMDDVSLSDLWSDNEKSVPPTYVENETESDKLNPNPSIEAGSTESENIDITVTPTENVEVMPVNPEVNLPVEEEINGEPTVEIEIPQTEEVDNTVTEEVTKDESEDVGEPKYDPDEPLEHSGGTGEVVDVEEPDNVVDEVEPNEPLPNIPVGFVGLENTVYLFSDGVLIDEWNINDWESKNQKHYSITKPTGTRGNKSIKLSQFELMEGKTEWAISDEIGTLSHLDIGYIVLKNSKPIYLCAI